MEKYFDLSVIFAADFSRCVPIVFVCCIIVIIAAFMDMWTAIDASKVCKEKIESAKLRKTINKILDYLRLIFYFFLLDCCGFFFESYKLPFATILATIGVLLVEGHSIIKENMVKKKSGAADIPDMIKQIIECVTEKDAEKIIEVLNSKNKSK